MRKTEEKIYYLNLDDMKKYENRVKLLYAFLSSPAFFHQDIAIINPNPKMYDNEHIFPLDMYRFTFCRDQGEDVPELEAVLSAVSDVQVPVMSIGSHKEQIDRTIVLGVLPDNMSGNSGLHPEQALTIRFIGKIDAEERKEIMDRLINAYYSIASENL